MRYRFRAPAFLRSPMRTLPRHTRSCVVGFVCLMLLWVAPGGYGTEAPTLRSHYVAGVRDVPLNVVEAGDAALPCIVFIHGLGQSHLSWREQLRADALTSRFHLVAFDLRGHGNSGRPSLLSDYSDASTWGEDVARVVQATCHGTPLIVGWSYGTWVAIDYLALQPRPQIAGLVLIGGLGGLVPPTRQPSPRAAELIARIGPLASSGYLEDSLLKGRLTMQALAVRPIDAVWNEEMAATNALLPPFARSFIVRRSLDHTAMLAQLRAQTLVILGSEDPTQSPEGALKLKERAPNVDVHVYSGTGHLPFAEEPQRFNADLEQFASKAFSHQKL